MRGDPSEGLISLFSQSKLPNLSNICKLYSMRDFPLGRNVFAPGSLDSGYNEFGTKRSPQASIFTFLHVVSAHSLNILLD